MSKDMFKIEAFVEDKNLARVKRLLSGLVLDFVDQPVINASAKNGKIVAKTNGNALEMFALWLKERKLQAVTPEDVRNFLEGVGLSPGSYSHLLSKAIDAKMVRRDPKAKGVHSRYNVLPAKEGAK